MNELLEGEGRAKDRTKETVLPRQSRQVTRELEPSLNQQDAAAESLCIASSKPTTAFTFVLALLKPTQSRFAMMGDASPPSRRIQL